MRKILDIDYYLDGYGAIHTNCVDNPFAAASGYYNIDNYYYYCFYNIALYNWGKNSEEHCSDIEQLLLEGMGVRIANSIGNNNDIFKVQESILKKLGLGIVFNKADNIEEFLEFIKNGINRNYPLIMLPINDTLFYYYQYMTENYNSHALIISGYDEERKLILIQDSLFDRELSKKAFKGEPFYKLFLKEEELKKIWSITHEYYEKNNSSLYNKELLSLEKVSKPEINSYLDLSDDFIEKTDINNSYFVKIVESFNNNSRKFSNLEYIYDLRRIFYFGLVVIFDIFEKINEESNYDEDIYEELIKHKVHYMKSRDLIINKLHYYALKKKVLTNEIIRKMKQEINSNDQKLYLLLKKIRFN